MILQANTYSAALPGSLETENVSLHGMGSRTQFNKANKHVLSSKHEIKFIFIQK